MRLTALYPFMLLSVAACTSPCDPQTPTSHLDDADRVQSQAVVVRDDTIADRIVVLGWKTTSDQGFNCTIPREGVRLSTTVSKGNGAVVHMLDGRFHWTGSQVDQFVSARLGTSGSGDELKMLPTDRQAGVCSRFLWIGCDHDDQVGAVLSEELLQEKADQGIDVTFLRTSGGRWTAHLSAEQIKAQLAEVDRVKGRLEK